MTISFNKQDKENNPHSRPMSPVKENTLVNDKQTFEIQKLKKKLQEKEVELQQIKDFMQDLKQRHVLLGKLNNSLKNEVRKLNLRTNQTQMAEKEYLKIVFNKFFNIENKKSLIPVIGNILGFSQDEISEIINQTIS